MLWRNVRLLATALLLAVCLLVSAEASAQTVSPSVAAAARKQATVRVTDDTGQEFSGRLLRVDDQIFTLKTEGGNIPFSFQRVSTIYRRGDSLRNGLIIGLVAGTAIGAMASRGSSSCAGAIPNPYTSCTSSKSSTVTSSIVGWTALCVGIDALRRGWTRIYPPRRPASVTSVQP